MSCDVHELIGDDFSCDGYIVFVTGALGTTASVLSIQRANDNTLTCI